VLFAAVHESLVGNSFTVEVRGAAGSENGIAACGVANAED
jgi:hypothetical protein